MLIRAIITDVNKNTTANIINNSGCFSYISECFLVFLLVVALGSVVGGTLTVLLFST